MFEAEPKRIKVIERLLVKLNLMTNDVNRFGFLHLPLFVDLTYSSHSCNDHSLLVHWTLMLDWHFSFAPARSSSK